MSDSSGRVSPEVYRRRRIVVGVLALLVLALIIWLISWAVTAVSALFGGDSEPEIKSTPIVSEAPEKEITACNPEDIELTASTAAESFALSADEAIMEMTIVNTSPNECTFNVGTNQQEFLITSGEDRIFSSKDCQVDGEDLEMTLKPKKKELARFGWAMKRSAPKCADVSAKPQQGTYKLTVKLGKLSSEPATFYLR